MGVLAFFVWLLPGFFGYFFGTGKYE